MSLVMAVQCASGARKQAVRAQVSLHPPSASLECEWRQLVTATCPCSGHVSHQHVSSTDLAAATAQMTRAGMSTCATRLVDWTCARVSECDCGVALSVRGMYFTSRLLIKSVSLLLCLFKADAMLPLQSRDGAKKDQWRAFGVACKTAKCITYRMPSICALLRAALPAHKHDALGRRGRPGRVSSSA